VIAETDQRLQHDGVALWVAGLPTRALAKARRTAAAHDGPETSTERAP